MSSLRILLANEPRAYRETIAAALRMLRPKTEVRIVEPDSLDREFVRFASQLVVCSRLTSAVETGAFAWVELYPGHGPMATVSIGGERSVTEEIGLQDLLYIVDQTEVMAEAG